MCSVPNQWSFKFNTDKQIQMKQLGAVAMLDQKICSVQQPKSKLCVNSNIKWINNSLNVQNASQDFER